MTPSYSNPIAVSQYASMHSTSRALNANDAKNSDYNCSHPNFPTLINSVPLHIIGIQLVGLSFILKQLFQINGYHNINKDTYV